MVHNEKSHLRITLEVLTLSTNKEIAAEKGISVFLPSEYTADVVRVSGEEKDISTAGEFMGHIQSSSLGNILRICTKIVEDDFEEQYGYLKNNCQEFCNTFLKKFKLSTYTTTLQKARTLFGLDH